MYTSEQIKQMLTVDNIINICCALQGSETVLFDSHNNPIFSSSLDHEGSDSWKLYYFVDSQSFYCFSGKDDPYDIFELVKRAKGYTSFKEAFNFVKGYFHLDNFGLTPEEEKALKTKIELAKLERKRKRLEPDPEIQENILEFFYPLASPVEWLKEGISTSVMNLYGIRVDAAAKKIIIPQRDVKGRLVGIRGRSFNPRDIDSGKKYMPVKIEKDLYSCPLGKHLYGLYQNKNYISSVKTVLLVEGEKSVLQMSSFYSPDKCYAVATCGFNVSEEQIDLLLKCGVKNVIVGFDRDFKGSRGDKDTLEFENKLLKVIKPLLNYFNVYILIDYDHLLGYKDSPTDKGKEIYECLWKNKIRITEDMYW